MNIHTPPTATRKEPLAVDRFVGGRIRSRLKQLGLSQEKLGNLIGITFQQIQKYEKGTNRVSASRMTEIAAALNVTPAYFFPDTGAAPIAANADPLPIVDNQQMLKAIARVRLALDAAEALLSAKH